MRPRPPQNIPASVRQRLLNLAREQGKELQFVLIRFASERLLYRLSLSAYSDEFLLKGAMLFVVWRDDTHRPTLDLDLEARGERTPEYLRRVFQDLCGIEDSGDGLIFDPASIRIDPMKEFQRYPGFRIHLTASLGVARIPLQIDIGYGDAIVPRPVEVQYPTLLDHAAPVLQVYPMETVVAEKFQAMVLLGMVNTRMKDFYDLWVLARSFEFRGADLSRSIHATFERRQTRLPAVTPVALGPEFHEDPGKNRAWSAFLKKSRLLEEPPALSEVCGLLSSFLIPPTKAASAGLGFEAHWVPTGPWRPL
ncbi:MAG TPA: nucleotidyl transferase AbiEii/AbiGii toxin family protein [Thermoanaerobaculia bacterium]